MTAILVVAGPLIVGAVAMVLRWRSWLPYLGVVSSSGVLALGIVCAVYELHHGALVGAFGNLRIDSLSSFMLIVIGLVSLLASWGSVRYLALEILEGHCTARQATHYVVLVQLFVTAMVGAVCAANIGVLWVAVEATTITTTFLVGHRRTRGALEASWKYLMICSVGIALAFLGTVVLYLAAQHAGAPSAHALDWTWLTTHAHLLNPSIVRLSLALLVLGYGTKVGLAPMHSWLPDAHSQAPAPVSALMSGVLLSVALYGLMRIKAIAVMSVGELFPRTLFGSLALVTMAIAAFLLVSQRDVKRALAYSSMEHMGLMSLAVAAGTPLALFGVLLHMMGHGLAKGAMFLTAGELAATEGSTDVGVATGLLHRRPGVGGLFALGVAALMGFPPFSMFVSEIAMLRGELDARMYLQVLLATVVLSVAFAALARLGRRLLFGGPTYNDVRTTSWRVIAPIATGLGACAFMGISTWPLGPLVRAAARLVLS